MTRNSKATARDVNARLLCVRVGGKNVITRLMGCTGTEFGIRRENAKFGHFVRGL